MVMIAVRSGKIFAQVNGANAINAATTILPIHRFTFFLRTVRLCIHSGARFQQLRAIMRHSTASVREVAFFLCIA